MRFGIRRPLPKVSVVIHEQPLMVEVHRLHCQFPYKLTYSKSPNITSAGSWPRNSTRSKGTTCPKQRGNIIVRIVLIKKPTQVDKYLRTHRTRRIYTRTVLVTITQNVPDKRTRRSKNHFVSISVSSSLTKVTLECSDNTQNVPEKLTHRSEKQFVSIIASSPSTKVTLEWSDDTFPFPNNWERQDTKYRHTGSNKSASYKYRTKTTSNNIVKPTSNSHEGLREGTIKYNYILPQKGGPKESTLEGESAINPISYQNEQIAPPTPPPQVKVQ